MEYVQERVATLHDLADPVPAAPTDEAAVVVPMTGRESTGRAAEGVLAALEAVDPARVVVALRTGAAPEASGPGPAGQGESGHEVAGPGDAGNGEAGQVREARAWLDGFDLPVSLLWCDGPHLTALLSDAGLDGPRGKGRDVWLAVGLAADAEYVVVHDADARSYSPAVVPRLLFPLARGYAFSKGYYARVEDRRLYGRLFRLLYAPLVRTLRDAHDAPVLEYLAAFRYALAGEFAVTGDLARSLRAQRGWGLEVGTLGEAFRTAGFDGSAQVDLGVHEHDHRAVAGPRGLSAMAPEVASALLRIAEEGGVAPDYGTLPDRFHESGERFVDRYALDAAFNGLSYDRAAEREQVREYARAVAPPGADDRLPAWRDAPLRIEAVREAARADLAEVEG